MLSNGMINMDHLSSLTVEDIVMKTSVIVWGDLLETYV